MAAERIFKSWTIFGPEMDEGAKSKRRNVTSLNSKVALQSSYCKDDLLKSPTKRKTKTESKTQRSTWIVEVNSASPINPQLCPHWVCHGPRHHVEHLCNFSLAAVCQFCIILKPGICLLHLLKETRTIWSMRAKKSRLKSFEFNSVLEPNHLE